MRAGSRRRVHKSPAVPSRVRARLLTTPSRHTVAKQPQPESHSPSPLRAMSTSQDRFARLEVKENPQDLAPKKVTLAFGRQGVDKLVGCLDDADVDIVTHALEVLDATVLKVQKNVVLFLKYKGVEALNNLTQPQQQTDDVVLLAVRCLVHVAAVNTGCARMLETKSVANVRLLLASEEVPVDVKLACYALLATLSSRLECVKHLLKEEILDFMLQRIDSEEVPQLKVAGMVVVANCGRLQADKKDPSKIVRGGGVAAVLAAGGGGSVAQCVALMHSEEPGVVAAAADILQVCSLTEEGRDRVVDAGAVKIMTGLVVSKSGAVRRAVTAALLSLTVSETGKKQFHRLEGCSHLVSRLSGEPSPDVLQNAIKIISAMCCLPAARTQLKDEGAPRLLQQIAADHPNATTRSVADLANKNVLWEP